MDLPHPDGPISAVIRCNRSPTFCRGNPGREGEQAEINTSHVCYESTFPPHHTPDCRVTTVSRNDNWELRPKFLQLSICLPDGRVIAMTHWVNDYILKEFVALQRMVSESG